MGENFYQKLPIDFLADFYIEIKKNIDKRILTDAMFVELGLIEEAAKEKGIHSIDDLLRFSTSYMTPA